jgi:hypothetical protein
MPTGPGFWLDPRTGALHRVTTHNDWLLVPENQKKAGLGPTKVGVLNSLDPVREIDEIRMVGVRAGLIRIRDYLNRVSIQFCATGPEVGEVLQAVVATMPAVSSDKFAFLTIQNLRDDSTARIHLPDLVTKLRAGDTVLHTAERVPYNEELRRKMDRLLEKAAD